MQSIRLSRRNFLKLNAIVGSTLAVAVALPAAAVPAASAANQTALQIDDLLAHKPAICFGTPTDVAATWPGQAWSVDAEGAIRIFDRAHHVWQPETSDDMTDFPTGSQLALARWGRPAGPNQMLLVLGPDVH
jgi:hypothetical protein